MFSRWIIPLLGISAKKVKYVVRRVIPPGKVRFIFTCQKKIMMARDHSEIEFHTKPIEIVKYIGVPVPKIPEELPTHQTISDFKWHKEKVAENE